LPDNIIMELCFLTYIEGSFALCETSKKVEERLYGADECWEKCWASMLYQWKRRTEMDWIDIPHKLSTPMPRSKGTVTDVSPDSVLY
jgi:hypothetical protein